MYNKEDAYITLANHLFCKFNSDKLKDKYNAKNAKKVINFEIMGCGANITQLISSDDLELINDMLIKTKDGIKSFSLSNFSNKKSFDLFPSGETINKDGDNWSNKVYAVMQDSLEEDIDYDLNVDKQLIHEVSNKIKNKFSKNDLNNFGEFIQQSAFISDDDADIDAIINISDNSVAADYFDLSNDYLKLIINNYRNVDLEKVAKLYNSIILLLK